MSGKNKGYLNNNLDFSQVETKDIRIAILVLGRVETEDIWIVVPIWCQVETKDFWIAVLIFAK